jgi:hypothetical protein
MEIQSTAPNEGFEIGGIGRREVFQNFRNFVAFATRPLH